nr:SMC-Scp complex subunit ScpB [Micromonospora sp. DSM 115978]
MTSEERPDSLAEQAAAWVPPWARERRPESTEGPAGAPEAEPAPDHASGDAVAGTEPMDGVDVVAADTAPATPPTAADPDPAPAEDLVVHPDRVPEAEPVGKAEPVGAVGPVGEAEPVGVVGAVGEAEPVGAVEPVAVPDADADLPVGRTSAGDQGSALALLDDEELRGALEAILLVVDEPVPETTLAQVLEQPVDRIGAALDRIADGYTAAGHGFELRRAAGGWRLYTRPEYAGYVERFVLDGQSVRLTQAALETLAVVAYKQPVTRSRISAIRGVNCDGVIRTLLSRGLVQECGTEPDSGAYLYRTTTLFLEKLGLDTVDELPPLAPFLPDDLEEMTDAPR